MAQHLRVGSVVNFSNVTGALVTNLTDAYFEVEYTDPSTGEFMIRAFPWSVNLSLQVVTD